MTARLTAVIGATVDPLGRRWINGQRMDEYFILVIIYSTEFKLCASTYKKEGININKAKHFLKKNKTNL